MTTPASVMDTSFLAAIYLPTDRHHGSAARWLAENYAKRDLVTPSLARCEFASVLARNGVSSDNVDEALASLGRRFTIFDTTEDLLQLATEVARDQRVRGCDSVFVALAMRQRAALVTFDVDQAQKGGVIVEVDCLQGDR
jgi:predicted nucleic acid-binding protein